MTVFCFAKREHAEKFRARFGGELTDPASRPTWPGKHARRATPSERPLHQLRRLTDQCKILRSPFSGDSDRNEHPPHDVSFPQEGRESPSYQTSDGTSEMCTGLFTPSFTEELRANQSVLPMAMETSPHVL
jgi:hypothetical protein